MTPDIALGDYAMRVLTEDEIPDLAPLAARAFLADGVAEEIAERHRLMVEPERTLGVFDGDRLVGTGTIGTRALRVPERAWAPLAAVTFVCVATDHRRRGILTGIMRAQLHGLHEGGAEPIAGLWASESQIYGRFGYGVATEYVRHYAAAKSPFRPGVDLGPDRVREVSEEEAAPSMRTLYDEYAANRPGALNREDRHWRHFLLDQPGRRNGASTHRYALHPEGYLVYRVRPKWGERGPEGGAEVVELVATTPRAHASLLRHLLDVDLVGEVEHWGAVDEPLPLLAENSRGVLRKLGDGLHLRLVDLDRALPLRTYSAPVDVVVEVADAFCPWNAGRWRLVVDGEGAMEVTRAGGAADLATSSTELAAAFLGGCRLTALAAAGRVVERTPGAVAALSAAFLAERDPACLEVF